MSAVSTRGWDSSRREKQRAAFLLGLATILAVLLFWLRREAGQYIFTTGSGQEVEMDIDLAKGNPIDVDLRDFYLPPPGIKLKSPPAEPQPLPDYDDEAHQAFAGYDNAFDKNPTGDGPGFLNPNIDISPPSVFVGAPLYGIPSPWLVASGPGFIGGPGGGNGGGPGGGNGPGAGNGPGSGGGPGGGNGPGGDNGSGNGGSGPGGDNGSGSGGGPGGGTGPGGGNGPGGDNGNGGGPGGGTPIAIPEPETGILLLGGLLGLPLRRKAKSVSASEAP